jgi:hypothetical protein
MIGPDGHVENATRQMGLPKVEEIETFDDAAEQAQVRAELGWLDHPGGTTLLVLVTNAGNADIPKLSAHWVHQNESPQPSNAGGIQAHELRGSDRLYPEKSFDGTLKPGETRAFQLDQQAMEMVRSQVAALSPERYRIAIACGDREAESIDGSIVGAFIDSEKQSEANLTTRPGKPLFSNRDFRSPENECPTDEPIKAFDALKKQFPSAEQFSLLVPYTHSLIHEVTPHVGLINSYEFEGRAPGTVRFFGPIGGSGMALARLIFVYRPEGWNTLYCPETDRWEEVRYAETNEPPYQSADFGPLAALKVSD